MKALYMLSICYYAGDIMESVNQSIIKLASEILAETDKALLCSALIYDVAHRVASLSRKWQVYYDVSLVTKELHRRSGQLYDRTQKLDTK
jgi:hypothetical protein